jgi:hypothetical protein
VKNGGVVVLCRAVVVAQPQQQAAASSRQVNTVRHLMPFFNQKIINQKKRIFILFFF